jgi:hypothetical protein
MPMQGYETGEMHQIIGLKPYPRLSIPFRNRPRCGNATFPPYYFDYSNYY